MYVNGQPTPRKGEALDEEEETQESEDENAALLTPALTPPKMDAPSLNHPVNMGNHREQVYPMVASFGSEGHHTSSPGMYNDTPSPAAVPHTPASSAMHSPHALPPSEYMGQPSFPTSSAEGQIHLAHHSTLPPQQPENVVSWVPPFRQNIFDPVDYNAGQTIPQPHFHYSMSMPPTSQAPELAHSQYHLPFRTGSLGHPNIVAQHPHFAGMTSPGSMYPGTSNNRSG